MRIARRSACLPLVLALAITPACRQTPRREAETDQPVPVIAEPVRMGNIRGTVSATGVVEAQPGAAFAVVALQTGKIAEITKSVGDAVTSGELLVRFDVPSLHAQTAVSSAAVKAAETRVRQTTLHQQRVTELVSKGAASQSEMEAADREADAATAELAAARAALSLTDAQNQNTAIRAPFNGTVVERHRNPGDTVRADDVEPILRLIDPKQVHVTTAVSIADAARFVVGASARSLAEGRPTPELMRVATRPPPEPGAKTVGVTLVFDTPTDLTPGVQVGIEIDAEQRSNVPLVPAVAVLKNADGPIVVVAAGTVAQHRPVVTGLVDGQHIEIRSGLKPGELIVTQGNTVLRNGAPISVSAP